MPSILDLVSDMHLKLESEGRLSEVDCAACQLLELPVQPPFIVAIGLVFEAAVPLCLCHLDWADAFRSSDGEWNWRK